MMKLHKQQVHNECNQRTTTSAESLHQGAGGNPTTGTGSGTGAGVALLTPPSIDTGVTSRIRAHVKYFLKKTTITNGSLWKTLPRFEREELQLGNVLGSGGFSDAFEVVSLNPAPDSPLSTNDNDNDDKTGTSTRKILQQRCQQRVRGRSPYVLKKLQPKLLDQPRKFKNAAVDLVVEAHVLASLDHPHILKIRGWSADASFVGDRHDSFFLILDRLDGTLSQRIRSWAKQLKALQNQPRMFDKILCQRQMEQCQCGSDVGGVQSSSTTTTTTTTTKPMRHTKACLQSFLFTGRMMVLRDIASALAYLHERGMIYRDLKPDNIGFDLHGNVKLFDFGLARQIPDISKRAVDAFEPIDASPESLAENAVFDMSKHIGTVRYMAPEVFRREAYNLKADVYSMSLVAWQVMALEKPFGDYCKADFKLFVVSGRERPSIENVMWPFNFRALLLRSWADDVDARPTMKQFHKQIEEELQTLKGDRGI